MSGRRGEKPGVHLQAPRRLLAPAQPAPATRPSTSTAPSPPAAAPRATTTSRRSTTGPERAPGQALVAPRGGRPGRHPQQQVPPGSRRAAGRARTRRPHSGCPSPRRSRRGELLEHFEPTAPSSAACPTPRSATSVRAAVIAHAKISQFAPTPSTMPTTRNRVRVRLPSVARQPSTTREPGAEHRERSGRAARAQPDSARRSRQQLAAAGWCGSPTAPTPPRAGDIHHTPEKRPDEPMPDRVRWSIAVSRTGSPSRTARRHGRRGILQLANSRIEPERLAAAKATISSGTAVRMLKKVIAAAKWLPCAK